MDEFEFRRVLELFPVVRSRDFQADSETSRQQSTSRSVHNEELNEWKRAWDSETKSEHELNRKELHDIFWAKLDSFAEKKVGASEAERFCKAFQQAYKKLVYDELDLDAARRFINSRKA